jgi:YHS domain-containing protein
MANVEKLLNRIDAEFSALDGRIKQAQAEHMNEYQGRQERLAAFEKLLSELPAVWKPRLDALLDRFSGKVTVTPRLSSTRREAAMDFKSELARIRLRLSASTDRDVRNLVLDYDLEILPMLMKFNSHEQTEWPLDAVDRQAIVNWIDDRLIDFVRAYLSLHENQYYLKDHMVEDPIAGVRFPKFAAATTIEWEGATHYFISDDTRSEFAAKHNITST